MLASSRDAGKGDEHLTRRTQFAAAIAAVLLVSPAVASEVTIAVGGAFTSLDPHYHNLTPNSALTQHLFDRLVHPDADLRPRPGLAVSWEAVEPTVWEFRLRPDARFASGARFWGRINACRGFTRSGVSWCRR